MKDSIENKQPAISVIIPVWHEAGVINSAIESLLDSACGPLEIIVVDAAPEQDTINAIRRRNVVTAVSGKGRAEQMNRGASLACGEILLFLHADTRLPRGGLMKVRGALKNPACKAGAFQLRIDSKRRVFRITEQYVALRTLLTRIPFGDQAIFVRRDCFQAIGGYRNIPLMEDVELMARIKKRGDKICIIPDRVMTSARRWEQEGILFCTFRNWALQLGYYLGISPQRLSQWYRQ